MRTARISPAYLLESGPGIRTCLVQTGAKLGPDSEIAPLERLRGKILERRTLTHMPLCRRLAASTSLLVL